MIYKPLFSRLLLVVTTFLFAFTLNAQEDLAAGEALFKAQCASCHNRNMVDDLTGPALGGVQERWADYPEEDLYAWIRNSQAQIAAGHPRATELWNAWKPTVMNNFNLTNEEIDHLLIYINAVYENGR